MVLVLKSCLKSCTHCATWVLCSAVEMDTKITAVLLPAARADMGGEWQCLSVACYVDSHPTGSRAVTPAVQVVYSCRHEYCETPEDFISRRCRLAFLDTQACKEALPRVRWCAVLCCAVCWLAQTCRSAGQFSSLCRVTQAV